MSCFVYRAFFVVSCVLALLPAQAVFAAQESLSDIYSQALVNDPTLAGAKHTKAAAMESLTQAWSKLRPSMNVSFNYSDTTQDILSSDNEVYDQGASAYTTQEYTLSLRQSVLRVADIKGIGQAKVEQVRADLQLQAANQDLIVRAAERYLQALSALDQLDFAKAEELAVRQHYELASGRFEMGLAPITDLHDAKARLASREARIIEADTQLVDAFEALRELTGEVPGGIMTLGPAFQPVSPDPDDAEQWVKLATDQNISVAVQSKAVEILRREVSIQKAGHYPTLDLVGSFNNQATEGSLFGGASEVETTEYGLQFNLPLYSGGGTASKTRQALQQMQKAESDLEKVLRESIRLARSSYLGVKNSISRIEALKQAVLSQNSTLEAKQEGYRSGIFTSLAVLDAERDLYQAKNELAQARYDYILNSLKLRQAVGSLNADDLNLASGWFTADPAAKPEVTMAD